MLAGDCCVCITTIWQLNLEQEQLKSDNVLKEAAFVAKILTLEELLGKVNTSAIPISFG